MAVSVPAQQTRSWRNGRTTFRTIRSARSASAVTRLRSARSISRRCRSRIRGGRMHLPSMPTSTGSPPMSAAISRLMRQPSMSCVPCTFFVASWMQSCSQISRAGRSASSRRGIVDIPVMSGEEQRVHARIHVSTSIEVRRATGGDRLTAVLKDLSKGGARFVVAGTLMAS